MTSAPDHEGKAPGDGAFAGRRATRSGGCACGGVRFTTPAKPKRAGLCHCTTCRKAHASAFNPFLVFDPADVAVTGEVRPWESSAGYTRWFCGVCGARVFAENRDADGLIEFEISLGSYDEVGVFAPAYESWIVRREPWLDPLDIPQYVRERAATQTDPDPAA